MYVVTSHEGKREKIKFGFISSSGRVRLKDSYNIIRLIKLSQLINTKFFPSFSFSFSLSFFFCTTTNSFHSNGLICVALKK